MIEQTLMAQSLMYLHKVYLVEQEDFQQTVVQDFF